MELEKIYRLSNLFHKANTQEDNKYEISTIFAILDRHGSWRKASYRILVDLIEERDSREYPFLNTSYIEITEIESSGIWNISFFVKNFGVFKELIVIDELIPQRTKEKIRELKGDC